MVTKEPFGQCPAGTVYAYTLKNRNGMAVTVLTFGATVQKICLPVRGEMRDVCLGYDDPDSYYTQDGYLGATVGRICNRIGGAHFTLNGKEYRLPANENGNQLHGGPAALSHRLWSAEVQDNAVIFSCLSPDGDDGYPGNIQVWVRYALDENNGLEITYGAISDQDTYFGMTNHTYFNLNGSGSVLDNTLQLDADSYTPPDAQLIPTGEIVPVAGTPLDFRKSKPLGQDFEKAGLYDNNFVLNGDGMKKAARLESQDLILDMETTQRCVQVYCACYDTPKPGKAGAQYQGTCFVCLEAQPFPDRMNHPNFPKDILFAGTPYHQTTVYRFTPKP